LRNEINTKNENDDEKLSTVCSVHVNRHRRSTVFLNL